MVLILGASLMAISHAVLRACEILPSFLNLSLAISNRGYALLTCTESRPLGDLHEPTQSLRDWRSSLMYEVGQMGPILTHIA